ncbi:MAG: hypothetical protein SVY10_07280 [Thermodesulfobacteriota bacterium]|nr:hypothetical protein [Thermodesulfobacteriota bacterium]
MSFLLQDIIFENDMATAFHILHLTQEISLVIVCRSKGEAQETVPLRYISGREMESGDEDIAQS